MATILVVDDMKTDREIIGKIVQQAGHRPEYATDGDEALDKAKAVKPGLILLDVVMARMSGFNACRKLKADAETKGIPVVLVTSKGGESDKFWGQKQGADDHIVKPIDPHAILAVVKRFVG